MHKEGNLLFSQFGRNLEKALPIQLTQLINLEDDNFILPKQDRHINKLYLFSLIRKQIPEKMSAYPFNAVSRSQNPSGQNIGNSYQANYSPKYEQIEKHIPTIKFVEKIQPARSKSVCSQDYYTINYSSFNNGKSYKMTKQSTKSSKSSKPIEKLSQSFEISSPKKPEIKIQVPDFSKYTKRTNKLRQILPTYDLLKVNYQRLVPRLDVGYVQFGKFIDKVKVRADRAETPPSVRLQYDSPMADNSRQISLDNKLPRIMQYPSVRPKLLPYVSKQKRYEAVSKELFQWLNKN